MSQENNLWQMAEYEGFEIHVAPRMKGDDESKRERSPTSGERYTYVGYVCHPGADPKLPGHTVPFHADADETFASAEAAWDEGVHVGRTIVDGTHPDLTVLPLVTRGV